MTTRPPLIASVLAEQQTDPFPDGVPGIDLRPVRADKELADIWGSALAVVLWEFRGDLLRKVWSADSSVDWIHVAGAGIDDIVFPALVDSDVIVTNSRGVFDRPVSEYAIALVLALAKDLRQTTRLQDKGLWHHRQTSQLVGSRLLVVGTGPIGRMIANLGRGLGMEIAGVGRRARTVDTDFGTVYGPEALSDQVALANHVVIAAPLTQETDGLFGPELFGSFRGATLVNIARGRIVDEESLLCALDDGRVSSAALDVFASEPLEGMSPLWSHERVIVSPHMAGDVPGVSDSLSQAWLDNLANWRAGRPLFNVVDIQHSDVVGSMRAQQDEPRTREV